MTFIRDEMYPGDLESWRYGMDDQPLMWWWLNAGFNGDEISTFLFGA